MVLTGLGGFIRLLVGLNMSWGVLVGLGRFQRVSVCPARSRRVLVFFSDFSGSWWVPPDLSALQNILAGLGWSGRVSGFRQDVQGLGGSSWVQECLGISWHVLARFDRLVGISRSWSILAHFGGSQWVTTGVSGTCGNLPYLSVCYFIFADLDGSQLVFGRSAGLAQMWQALEVLHGFQQVSVNLGVSRWVLWDLFGLGRVWWVTAGLGGSWRVLVGLGGSQWISVGLGGSCEI